MNPTTGGWQCSHCSLHITFDVADLAEAFRISDRHLTEMHGV